MIKYFQHEDIDLNKWDECIYQCTHLTYPLSWYLNCVSPNWNAFIIEKNNHYEAVFPICTRKKKGINYVYQPYFTQQLGYFSKTPSSQEFATFLKKLNKKFLHVDLNSTIKNGALLSEISHSFFLQENETCLLNLQEDYEVTYRKYNSNRKRDLKKAKKNNLECSSSEDINSLIKIFKETKGKEVSELKKNHYNNLKSIFHQGKKRQQAEIFIVQNKNDKEKILAAGLFLFSKTQITFLFGCTSIFGRNNGAMTFLMDYVIKKYANTNYILDFEGSNISSISHYYQSFGAEPYTYITIRDKKIYFLLERIRTIRNKFKLNLD